MNQDKGSGVSPQVEMWIRQIRSQMAAGLPLPAAASAARRELELLLGATLERAQADQWAAAQEHIREGLERPIEYLRPHSVHKPRRPEWYEGSAATDLHWPSLKAFLLQRRRWSASTVDGIEDTSAEVTGMLEDPSLASFSGRGLVVGHVQSGKTANMTAVIARAADAGYRFVVILSGLTNALRRQTQSRLVSDLIARNPELWHLHTTVEDDGDFQTPPNRWFSSMDPIQVAVIKKNVTPLRRLITAIERTSETLRARMPVLVIDDECDQASVNSSGSAFDSTAINEAIRTLIARLPRVQYVGYTATPFANVLINPHTAEGALDDLYPRDFVTALPASDEYFGTEALFGRPPNDADAEQLEEQGLDMIREVPAADAAAVRPASRARAGFSPTVPPSLEEALRWFVLSSSARLARGQEGQHFSMLIHTTVYTDAHERIAALIREWKAGIEATLTQIEPELEALWVSEAARVDGRRWGLDPLPWSSVQPFVRRLVEELEIIVENSISESRLDFGRGTPCRYIVVGGSVLARGLTIEGLSVSYFVRSSSQYDTLLQMGRWFGYRPGYQDLPRIWMTADLAGAFRDLAQVEAEIRQDIAEYARRDLTPMDLAVRIRQIPGMSITSAAKMIASETCDVSFSGEHLQTIRFASDDLDQLNRNWAAGAGLLDRISQARDVETVARGRLIRGAPLDAVADFLETYSASSRDAFGAPLMEWIAREAETGPAFRTWNVGLIEPAKGSPSMGALGTMGPVRTVRRARLSARRGDGLADIKALMSRRDVLFDVEGNTGPDDWAALKRYRQNVLGDEIPLLLLYAIEARSEPTPGTTYRAPLDAATDVLAIGLVLPDRGQRRSFVRVTLDREDADEGEDLMADIGGLQ
ncbi:Z1 domain-containing protein [Brevundimonas sp.]|uniref:Z1 domain-containing protein n=1 Tax=Brevundimonas sp. TaxID=1871086 RepID=UPI002488AA2C|nr:Z1 domain-containing protein [Brevundimonas sp.]MDI1282269.1 Z1 domain-containing protein [Brevundimonas sp.]